MTTTNSTPSERAGSPLVPVTAATLALTSVAAATATEPGGLAASITGTDPGDASVTTTVVARGPLPVRNAGCDGDFDAVPVAGSSKPTSLRRAGGKLQAVVAVPDVRAPGCYSLSTRSEVTVDNATVATGAIDPASSTTAILQPSIVVSAAAVSGQQGRPMPGVVQVSGTFGFPGVVAVGVVEGTTIPISGCRDSTFIAGRKPATAAKVSTRSDAAYPFRSPTPTRNACYTVAATFTLNANPAVTASSGAANDATVFLAGVRPDADVGSVVQHGDAQGIARAIITFAVTASIILAGALALFVRTFNRERGRRRGTALFRWRPNRGDDNSDAVGLFGRPSPGAR